MISSFNKKSGPHTSRQGSVAIYVAVAALVIACCAVAAVLYADAPRSGPDRASHPAVKIAWQRPFSGLLSAAFSPTTECFCTVSSGHAVSCYTSAGDTIYSAAVPNATRAVAVPDGSFTLAFSHKNPVDTAVTILDRWGAVHWRKILTGAVWCADSARSEDGARFVVGTGAGWVYVFTVEKNVKRYKRWRADGAVVSIVMSPDGEHLTFGTWQKSTIGHADLSGKIKWQMDADSASLQYVEPLHSPDRLLVRSVPNRADADGAFFVMDLNGNLIWQGTVNALKKTRVLASPDGRYVCLGYQEQIEHKGKSLSEPHAVLYNASGDRLWDRGSLLFPAEPVVVTSAGYVLLASARNTLFTVSPAGEIKQSAALPAGVKRMVVARDGTKALINCEDDSLCMLKILQ